MRIKIKAPMLGLTMAFLSFVTSNLLAQTNLETKNHFDNDTIGSSLQLDESDEPIPSTLIPEGPFEVANQAVVISPETGKLFYQFKLVEPTGEVQQITLDKNGKQVANETISRELRKRYICRRKISPQLTEKIKNATPKELIPVNIWCRMPTGLQFPSRPDPESVREDRNSENLVANPVIKSKKFDQISFELKAMSFTMLVADQVKQLGKFYGTEDGAPIVYGALNKGAILKLAASSNVLEIYDDEICQQHMSVVRLSTRAHVVNNRGLKGNGIKVGVIEVGGRANSNHPFIDFYQYQPYASTHDHAAAVAGVIASKHPRHKGIAPNAELYLGGTGQGSSSELIHIMHHSRRWGANVINNSWGSHSYTPGSTARACDYISLRYYKTIVIAAGNSGRSHGYVGSPGNCYNGISVGATDNRRTGRPSDDRMASFSSFRNPISPRRDRQKPDLVAPGGNLFAGDRFGIKTLAADRSATDMPSAGPWFVNAQGTSFSSPVVAGGAALLMQRSRSLKQWPESVKAILTATAMHNIEGDRRQSNYDGAGSIMLDRADDAAANRRSAGWSGITYDSNRPATLDLRRIYLKKGRRVRIAIVWNQNTNYSLYSSQPCADLDLQIIAPNGSVQTESYSWDNTLEIVDFRPPRSGTYKIRVKRIRMEMSPKYLGYAWYQE